MAADVEVKSHLKAVSLSSTTLSTGFNDSSTTSCDIQLESNGEITTLRQRDARDDSCLASTLPLGWIREVRQRKAGKTAGKMDIYITSPQGQRFRSRASLHAFLLKDGEGNLDINLFDFTTSKDDVITTSQVKQRRRRKNRHADGQQETTGRATEILDPPPNKSKRASSSCRSDNKDKEAKSTTVRCCMQATPLTTGDDVKLQTSPQRTGQLREKLLRLTPSSKQQNTLIAQEDAEADPLPSVPTLNVEPATESENEGEDEQGGNGIYSKDDNKANSEVEAGTDSCQDEEEEVLLTDNTGGSYMPVIDSQSKSKSVEDKRKTSPYFSRKPSRDGNSTENACVT